MDNHKLTSTSDDQHVFMWSSLIGGCGSRLLVQYSDPTAAKASLAILDPADGSLTELTTDYYGFGRLSVAEVSTQCLQHAARRLGT